jgi:hypothetical protein
MTIENHVTSLKLSKRLHELGVRQKSLFCWITNQRTNKWTVVYGSNHSFDLAYPAYLASELGEMLPQIINIKGISHKWLSAKYDRDEMTVWEATLKTYQQENLKFFPADNEANARAKMMIYLLENDLIKL